ncbi:hypothetical protein INT43_004212 [Umbelopsis isabellina]|uniref:NADH dehydrogenase [ubiquinone] 1 beta subcomplex subunit 9 n=1 Tax=Mortierella isabellina TaxID=91625 RepID=A0A8H7PHU1_MORIS|nr:hypothetical protein INT43_004212 [Umbelopsis isabellina]
MSSATASFQTAHRLYVKSLYKRSLKLSLDWYIRRDLWRQKALEIRHQFELNKNVTSPKELQQIFAKTEKQLEEFAHPDPYKLPLGPEGTKWERNVPPRMEYYTLQRY